MNLQDYINIWGVPEEEDPYLEQPEDRYTIYQIKEESLQDCVFLSFGMLSKFGENVSKDRYQEVYSDVLKPGTTLDELFRKFNVDHPADYTGRNLSVSDVVVLHKSGKDTAYYCDLAGWQEVPGFLSGSPGEQYSNETVENDAFNDFEL